MTSQYRQPAANIQKINYIFLIKKVQNCVETDDRLPNLSHLWNQPIFASATCSFLLSKKLVFSK